MIYPNFDQVNKFCTAATFIMCGGQMHNDL